MTFPLSPLTLFASLLASVGYSSRTRGMALLIYIPPWKVSILNYYHQETAQTLSD